jgi:hypothetical protein
MRIDVRRLAFVGIFLGLATLAPSAPAQETLSYAELAKRLTGLERLAVLPTPGDKLEVIVPVQEAGRYRVSAVLTKARDYGIVRLQLDGKPVGEAIDLYNPDVIPTVPPVALGTHELTAGEHRLTVEIVGANEMAIKAYMFGLDRVLLEGVK